MIGAAWAVEVLLLFVRDLGGNLPANDTFKRRPPYPWELLSSLVVFGLLTGIGQNPKAAKPAAAVAWGLVIATFIGGQEKFSQPQGNAALDALGSISRFLSGGYANTSGGTVANFGPSGSNIANQTNNGQISTGLGGTVAHKGGQQA